MNDKLIMHSKLIFSTNYQTRHSTEVIFVLSNIHTNSSKMSTLHGVMFTWNNVQNNIYWRKNNYAEWFFLILYCVILIVFYCICVAWHIEINVFHYSIIHFSSMLSMLYFYFLICYVIYLCIFVVYVDLQE